MTGSNYNTVDVQNLASDMTHYRHPSKPNVTLKHGLCQKNCCLLKLPWNSFTHTLTSLTVLTPFRLSPESGGLGGVLWSIKLETFKIQHYMDF